LSQHLARLRRDGIVDTRREAQTIYYSIKDATVPKLLECLAALYAVPLC
jgi:DNA-binding transcriptional ArsR family regulator